MNLELMNLLAKRLLSYKEVTNFYIAGASLLLAPQYPTSSITYVSYDLFLMST